MPNYQITLDLIPHEVENSVIPQRESDGYVNATAMCKACGKKLSHYLENSSTKEFLTEMSSDAGIPASELIQIIKGGEPHLQGSWMHPHVAIHLAQWLSPKFAVMVTKWVHDWMSGKLKPKTGLPPHLLRHQMNAGKIPVDYFSVLQEMTNMLVAPLEVRGYTLPSNLMPDISQGRLFCKHLRDHHNINTDDFKTYTHEYPDGRTVQAKLYPLELLGIFRRLMAQEWLPQAEKYFKTRDGNALPALQQLLQVTYNPPANNGAYKIKA